MAVRHMADDEIQAYLEKGTSALDQVFDAHLSECRECRERVNEYRRLFTVIGEDRGFELSPGFAEAVTARIVTEQAEAARRRWTSLLLILAGAVVAFGAMAYFMDLRPLWDSLVGVFAPSLQRSAAALDGVQRTVTADTATILMILFCVLILAAVAGADHLLFRQRQAKYCL